MPQRRNVELVVRDGDGKLVYRLTLPRDPIEDTAYLAALVGGQEVSAIACDRPVTSAAQASGSDGRS